MKLNPKRVFFVMVGLLALLGSLTIGSVVFGNKMLQKKSSELLNLKLDNRTLEEQQLSLVRAKKDVEKYAELERTAKAIVPQEKDQARTVREIINIASAADVKIGSVSFPTSTLGQAPPKPAAPSEGDKPSATPAAPPITQVKPVENIKDVYKMEVTVQSDSANPVTYSKLIDFLSRLEHNRRTAQVTSITVQPSTKNRTLVTFNVVLNVYIKP